MSKYSLPSSQLKMEKKLGSGAFGIVYLAKFRGDNVAVKQITSNRVDEENLNRFVDEIVLLSKLHHPNISQVLAERPRTSQ